MTVESLHHAFRALSEAAGGRGAGGDAGSPAVTVDDYWRVVDAVASRLEGELNDRVLARGAEPWRELLA